MGIAGSIILIRYMLDDQSNPVSIIGGVVIAVGGVIIVAISRVLANQEDIKRELRAFLRAKSDA